MEQWDSLRRDLTVIHSEFQLGTRFRYNPWYESSDSLRQVYQLDFSTETTCTTMVSVGLPGPLISTFYLAGYPIRLTVIFQVAVVH